MIVTPAPLTRTTVPRTSTVAASRSSASQVTADASPIRSPVASMKSVKSTRSQPRHRSSAWIFCRRSTASITVSARADEAALSMRPTSRTGLRSSASWRTASPTMPLSTVRVVLAAATPNRSCTCCTSRSSRATVNSRTRSMPTPLRTWRSKRYRYCCAVVGERLPSRTALSISANHSSPSSRTVESAVTSPSRAPRPRSRSAILSRFSAADTLGPVRSTSRTTPS